jgi:peptidoglycan/LPS O-acetylase OafA/YrhL
VIAGACCVITQSIQKSVKSPRLYKLEQWYESDHSPSRNLAMEGLRGLAILLVFLCHFQIVILTHLAPGFQSNLFKSGAEIGGTGVDLFFVLSGMLIYRAAMKPELHYGRFLLRRVQRIYPTFLAVLAFYLVLSRFLHVGEHYSVHGRLATISYVLTNVLLLPGLVDIPPIISAAWSLSYEISFYLAIPLLVRLLELRRWKPRTRAICWSSIIASYICFVLFRPEALPRYHYFDGSFVRFTMFLCGMLIEESLNTGLAGRLLTPRMQALLLGAGAGSLALLFWSEMRTVTQPEHNSPQHAALRAALVLVIYLGLTATALCPAGVLNAFFSGKWLRWNGNISYSTYLIHGFTLNVLAVAIVHMKWISRHPLIAAPLILLIACSGTLITATALFLAIEKPYSLRPRRIVSS